MATSDKVQKLSGEAFHKLKSDHEQFLEAYEKPTQIYRFLKARHSLKPLFLHRNLSYMRMHRHASEARQKRKRKLRVDELIEHTKVSKPDLASEIKSDNHLKISFSGLEDGIDLSQLLADATETSSKSTNQNRASRPHERELVEIEVLLYSFSQPSAEALLSGDKNSFQCSCSSLGKQVISHDIANQSRHGCLPLTIPESSLTWKHRQGLGGTHMLVFKACHYSSSATSTGKAKKKGRKNGIHGSKQAESADSVRGSSEAAASLSAGSSSVGAGIDLQRTLLTDVMTGESVALPKSVTAASDQYRMGGSSSKNSQSKPETKDACVMTDIRFGTDVINELTPIYQSQISSVPSQGNRDSSAPLLHNGSNTHIRKSPKPSRCRSTSPHCSRQDKCTSPLIPRLALRNGVLNGYNTMNGYAAPTVTAVRQNIKKRKKMKRKLSLHLKGKSSLSFPPRQTSPMVYSAPEDDLVQLLKKPKSLPIKRLGSGKQGVHSFLVSIPRVLYREKSLSTSEPPGNKESKNIRSPRRTEIQLLLDGDKPRGQRVSGDQVPKFTAEDVSSWSTNSADKASWLGSSTRKITPVDLYNYPLSPKKFTNGGSPPLVNDRKRSHSEGSENSTLPSPKPPLKCSRLSSSSDTSSTKLPPSSLSPSTDQSASTVDQASTISQSDEPTLNCSVAPQDTVESLFIQPNEVFCAELAVFDSRGDCLLRDGEYSVMMESCPDKEEEREPADLLIFEPLTWTSVFACAEKKNATVKKSKNFLLKFSLCWTDGPPQHQLCSNLDTALDLKKIRESYYLPSTQKALSPPLPTLTAASETGPPLPAHSDMDSASAPSTESQSQHPVPMDVVAMSAQRDKKPLERKKVFLNFLYGNNSLQQTECREDMRCPWCFIRCQSLYSLLKHLSLCHPRFQFTYSPSLHRAKVIDVHVNKLYDTSSSIERDPGERDALSLVKRKQRPAKAFSCTCVLVDRGVEVVEDLSEFMNDGSWRRGYNTNRMYYHSNSCLPMLAEEIKVDSEGEESTLEWQKICCQKMLDDFTDVNKGEKRLMKLWNLFVMEHKLIAEKQIPEASLLFAKKNRKKLLEERIDKNFLSHLISLYEFGLISPSVIRQCMCTLYEAP